MGRTGLVLAFIAGQPLSKWVASGTMGSEANTTGAAAL